VVLVSAEYPVVPHYRYQTARLELVKNSRGQEQVHIRVVVGKVENDGALETGVKNTPETDEQHSYSFDVNPMCFVQFG
jgi:hypothetical protein